MRIPTVLFTGTVGSGKTAVVEEVVTLLREQEIPHAAIDLDWLCQVYPPPPADPYNEDLMLSNLSAIWDNLRKARPDRLVLARVIENREHLTRYQHAIPGAEITVVRVLASERTILERLRRREVGSYFEPTWARSRELAAILQQAQAEDFAVSNDGRPIREVAMEAMSRLGWVDL